MAREPLRPFPGPVMMYSIVHQRAARVPEPDYVVAMKELQSRIIAETELLLAGVRHAGEDHLGRERQLATGLLSPFLQTPLKTDLREVGRILDESLRRFASALGGNQFPALFGASGGKFFFPASRNPQEKQLTRRGREYLDRLGFNGGKQDAAVYETLFTLQGGVTLDLLEHIVKERIGVYRSVHGKHLEQCERSACALQNLLRPENEIPALRRPPGSVEAVLWFSKREMEYARFLTDLFGLLDALKADVGSLQWSVWQRKLGLGTGEEFALRITDGDEERVADAIRWLVTSRRNTSLYESVVARGSLAFREEVA